MFCKKCGKKLSDDTVFCNYCGAKQDAAVGEEETKVSAPETDKKAETKAAPKFEINLDKKMLIIIGAAVVAVITAIVLIFVLACGGGDKSGNTDNNTHTQSVGGTNTLVGNNTDNNDYFASDESLEVSGSRSSFLLYSDFGEFGKTEVSGNYFEENNVVNQISFYTKISEYNNDYYALKSQSEGIEESISALNDDRLTCTYIDLADSFELYVFVSDLAAADRAERVEFVEALFEISAGSNNAFNFNDFRSQLQNIGYTVG